MIIVFRNETHSAKLNYVGGHPSTFAQLRRQSIVHLFYNFFACDTWMCRELGEGKEEVENHGRSRVKVSSQETDLIGQWSLRMRANEAEQKNSTGCTTVDSNFPPHLLSSTSFLKSVIPSLLVGGVALLRSSPRASALPILKMTSFFAVRVRV